MRFRVINSALLQVDQVTTDKVAAPIAAGNSAYVGASGLFSATPPADGTTEDERAIALVDS